MGGSCGWFPMRREEIQAWVDAHRAELPRTLAELSTYPMEFRRVIVWSVPAEQRIAFWRAHLESFLTRDAVLSPEQRTLITDAIAELPALFGSPLPEGQVRVRALEDRMRGVLTREQAAHMFGMVGPPEPPEGLPLPPGAAPTPAG